MADLTVSADIDALLAAADNAAARAALGVGGLAASNTWTSANVFPDEVEFDTTTTFIFSGTSAAALRTALGLSALATTTPGTGIATALAVNTGSAGAPVINGGTMTGNTITGYTETVVAIGNSGTTQTLAITAGTVQTCTLTGNCTFTMPTATAGKSFVLYLRSGAGGFTGTFTGVKWSGGTAPTITATASRMDILTFVADGTNWYGSAIQDFTP